MTDKKEQFIKNIEFSTPVDIVSLVDYEEGRVVSRTLASRPHVNITLFAFDRDEEISAHTSPGDAMIQILDGEALVNINGRKIKACKGQVVVMPANVPHAVSAVTQFKMILTVVKHGTAIGDKLMD